MDSQSEQRLESAPAEGEAGAGGLRVVLILAALAAVGTAPAAIHAVEAVVAVAIVGHRGAVAVRLARPGVAAHEQAPGA